MSYTAVTKPVQGEATRKPKIDAMIDNDAFFASTAAALNWLQVPNGSFEIDTDADSIPDLWTRTLYTGGSFALTGNGLGDTECRHGARAIKFTSPGGGGNGGGYIETTEYQECEPERPVVVSWLHKSSVTNIRNKVELLWYDANRVSISTSTIYTSILNPTSWRADYRWAFPPTTARFFRIRLVGAENTTTVAGSAYFDDVKVMPLVFTVTVEFAVAGSYLWTCPADVYFVEIKVTGAGAAGGSANSFSSGGGGGGGTAIAMVAVTPGTVYAITIGAGGVASTSNNGGNGGNTTIVIGAVTYTGGGGSGGISGTGSGAGGAGGTATNGDQNITGNAGTARSGTTGGNGGSAAPWGVGVAGTTGNGTAGPRYGSGGAGDGDVAATLGGDGAPGLVTIRW